MAQTNWWLDIEEHLAPSGAGGSPMVNTFYVELPKYNEDARFSVSDFLDAINLQLWDRQTNVSMSDINGGVVGNYGKTMNLYSARAMLVQAGDFWLWAEMQEANANGAGFRWDHMGNTAAFIIDMGDPVGGSASTVDLGPDVALTAGGIAAAMTNGDPDSFVISYVIATHSGPSNDIHPDGTSANYSSAYNALGWKVKNIKVRSRSGMHGSDYPADLALGVPPGSDPYSDDYIDDPPYGTAAFVNLSSTVAQVVPTCSTQTIMLDNPPVSPNVRILPYMGVNNRLMIMLNPNTGEYLARPAVIRASDAQAIADMFLHQTGISLTAQQAFEFRDTSNNPLKILYKTDDPLSKYEVFRIETRPTSYADFGIGNNPHKTLESKLFVNKFSSAASLIDTISPNKKYYYCFRALDVHNNFSNPSHIFEAELVDNDGQTYLILNTIHLMEETINEKTKSGRRYLFIEPALSNMSIPNGHLETNYINATTTTRPGSNMLGGEGAYLGGGQYGLDPDVWDKTFKIRLTSKKTYKKIDLNITFKNTGVDYP